MYQSNTSSLKYSMTIITKISYVLFVIVMMMVHNKLQARRILIEDDSSSEERQYKRFRAYLTKTVKDS
jgi:hypothetical protein